MHPKDADGMANSVYYDQTAPPQTHIILLLKEEQSDLGLHCCSELSVQTLTIITVSQLCYKSLFSISNSKTDHQSICTP